MEDLTILIQGDENKEDAETEEILVANEELKEEDYSAKKAFDTEELTVDSKGDGIMKAGEGIEEASDGDKTVEVCPWWVQSHESNE